MINPEGPKLTGFTALQIRWGSRQTGAGQVQVHRRKTLLTHRRERSICIFNTFAFLWHTNLPDLVQSAQDMKLQEHLAWHNTWHFHGYATFSILARERLLSLNKLQCTVTNVLSIYKAAEMQTQMEMGYFKAVVCCIAFHPTLSSAGGGWDNE